MEERQWKLGEDLSVQDSVLDGFTFEELITTVRCNCKYVNGKSIKEEAKRILDIHIQDMNELIARNIDLIVEEILGDKPLNMSFFHNTLNRYVAKKKIEASDKPLVYTYGYEYRCPSTHRVPIDKEKAFKIIDKNGYLDITEEENCIHLNEFSDNDMW